MEFDDFEEIAKLAYLGKEIDDLAPVHTRYMYLRLYDLYDFFNKGKYTKQQCIELKSKLKNEYKGLIKEHDRDMECYREYLENRKTNTGLLIELEKSKSKEEMLDICLKIISNCIHDKDLYRRNTEKFQNNS